MSAFAFRAVGTGLLLWRVYLETGLYTLIFLAFVAVYIEASSYLLRELRDTK